MMEALVCHPLGKCVFFIFFIFFLVSFILFLHCYVYIMFMISFFFFFPSHNSISLWWSHEKPRQHTMNICIHIYT